MALWTVLAAPLFMSTDLRTISAQNMDILQNPLMIDPFEVSSPLKQKGKTSCKGEMLSLFSFFIYVETFFKAHCEHFYNPLNISSIRTLEKGQQSRVKSIML